MIDFAPSVPMLRPFAGLRPAPGRASEVIAPLYDVVSCDEARARASRRPWSFLHVSRPEIDLPQRVRHVDYERRPVPAELYVPEVY